MTELFCRQNKFKKNLLKVVDKIFLTGYSDNTSLRLYVEMLKKFE